MPNNPDLRSASERELLFYIIERINQMALNLSAFNQALDGLAAGIENLLAVVNALRQEVADGAASQAAVDAAASTVVSMTNAINSAVNPPA